jgi:uncharacterized membrane protein YbhN (UPF0104 family)
MKTISSFIQKFIPITVFVGFVILVQYYYGWPELLAPWRQLSGKSLLIALFLIGVSHFLRAARVHDYFRNDTKGQFPRLIKVVLQHHFLNNLLPMRSGEISFPIFMSRYLEIPVQRSVPALAWFRFLDLHTIIGLTTLVAAQYVFSSWWLPLILLSLWLGLPILMIDIARKLEAALSGPRGKLLSSIRILLSGLPQSRDIFYRSWLWTIINWTVKLSVLAWLMSKFGEVSFYAAWVGASVGDLTSVLPFHGIAGFGTYEAGVVAGLAPHGFTPESALPLAVNLHLFILASSVLLGLIGWLIPARQS